jgi:hypothetical protein
MSAVGAVMERSERPAWVRFKRVAVEDKVESLKQGRYVGKDVDYALVTPPYSKDVIEMKVETWSTNLKADVTNGRIPKDWADHYFAAYDSWKKGEELPPVGTPIRGWGIISPAQQEMLVRINIFTVEDLAAANDEGLRRIGMGARELQSKAITWIAQLKDKGPLSIELTATREENRLLKATVEELQKKLDSINARLDSMPAQQEPQQTITADDILPETETVQRKRR